MWEEMEEPISCLRVQCYRHVTQLTAKRNLFDMSVECNPALNFLEKTLLYVQRSEKWLVRGWVKFIPALA